MPIAPSTFYENIRHRKHPELRSSLAKKDAILEPEIRRVWEESKQVYGVRKVWKQLLRDGNEVARCTVERLMRKNNWVGVTRKRRKKTTIPVPENSRPDDLVCRKFSANAPNRLWVADITYVAIKGGFAYVSFVIDVFSRRIVGWCVSSTLKTTLAIDALEQAICCRKTDNKLVHHSDRGVQYISIRYSERLAEAGIQASVGSVGCSYDNALAETINGLYKTEVIWRGRWENVNAVEKATLDWVHWYNHQRLFGKLGYVPPAEFESDFYKRHAIQKRAA